MTSIYLIRHSKTFKVNNELSTDDFQTQNEKLSLSLEGEVLAKEKLSLNEFTDIDAIYSSSFVRSIQTAKYIAHLNKLEIHIMSNLGERKFGISSWDELPEDYEKKQFFDDDYKIGSGESKKEVTNRMYNAIMKIANDNKNKKVAVVSHGTAIGYLLTKWCEIKLSNDGFICKYNGKILYEGNIQHCDIFKIIFNEQGNLVSIDKI